MRIALVAAALIWILLLLSVRSVLGALSLLILPLAGGFVSVYLYSRKTGKEISVGNGARMGWLTGMFCFVSFAILFTIAVAMMASASGRAMLAKSLSENPKGDEIMRQVEENIGTPAGVLGPLLMSFVLFTSLPTIGGALAAKVLEKD